MKKANNNKAKEVKRILIKNYFSVGSDIYNCSSKKDTVIRLLGLNNYDIVEEVQICTTLDKTGFEIIDMTNFLSCYDDYPMF